MTETPAAHTSTLPTQHPSVLGPLPDDRTRREHRRVRRARWVAATRAGVGLFCLVAPRRALVSSERQSPAARRVMRILGARHLAQAAVEAAQPTPTVLRCGAGVDAVHGLSCLGFAVCGGARWRHGVLVNAAAAFGFCAVTAATARTSHPHTFTRIVTRIVTHDNGRCDNHQGAPA